MRASEPFLNRNKKASLTKLGVNMKNWGVKIHNLDSKHKPNVVGRKETGSSIGGHLYFYIPSFPWLNSFRGILSNIPVYICAQTSTLSVTHNFYCIQVQCSYVYSLGQALWWCRCWPWHSPPYDLDLLTPWWQWRVLCFTNTSCSNLSYTDLGIHVVMLIL